MNKLTQNVINILGENGKLWITDLPSIISILADYWNLKNITPVDNMTYNYVAKAINNTDQPLVLKIGFDTTVIADERKALTYFDGNVSIQLIGFNEKYNALLLQQAVPGTSLKSLYPSNDKFVIDCYASVVKKLLNKPLPNMHNFRHIRDWLKSIDNINPDKLPKNLLEKAVCLKNKLLSSMTTEVVLHGDLHQDNILKDKGEWIVIDPKGIIGEPEFEIAAFDFVHNTELANNAGELFLKRLELLAEKSNANIERIKNWVFVRLILSAVWHIEDNCDASFCIKLAELFFNI